MAKRSRQTYRSNKGPKLYPVYDSKGRFKDIETYTLEHKKDMKKRRPMTPAEARLVEAAINSQKAVYNWTRRDGTFQVYEKAIRSERRAAVEVMKERKAGK